MQPPEKWLVVPELLTAINSPFQPLWQQLSLAMGVKHSEITY
jgi:hypothetical protein